MILTFLKLQHNFYLNCNEICYSNISLLFNEILFQIKAISQPSKTCDPNTNEFEMDIDDEKIKFQDDDVNAILNGDIDEAENTTNLVYTNKM